MTARPLRHTREAEPRRTTIMCGTRTDAEDAEILEEILRVVGGSKRSAHHWAMVRAREALDRGER